MSPEARASFLQPLPSIITTQSPWLFVSDLSAIQSPGLAQLTAGKINPGRPDHKATTPTLAVQFHRGSSHDQNSSSSLVLSSILQSRAPIPLK
ncbi:hypothetical protein M0R45_012035 [Rubus argutus]|uniref:Uncharacterized protein n=1 Tax=Rubus argutus TaxID=59490 RepID=A0AAW1YD41_RUBAR